MTLGEIKIEALKIMFLNTDNELFVENIEQYKNDEQYKLHLSNMIGSINRCFSNLESRNAIKSKVFDLDFSTATISNGRMRFDLSTLIDDYYTIERVVYDSETGYIPSVEYQMESDILVVEEVDNGAYKVIYKPTMERITSGTSESAVIDLPDQITTLIPYFIKGELFREDEPNEAGEARNWYEDGIETYRSSNQTKKHQNTVSQKMR